MKFLFMLNSIIFFAETEVNVSDLKIYLERTVNCSMVSGFVSGLFNLASIFIAFLNHFMKIIFTE